MSPFYELVKKIRTHLTLSQKVNGIVSALEELEKASAPFSRISEGFITPAPGFIANAKVTNADWVLRGQRLVCGRPGPSGSAAAYFIVDEVVDSTTLVLRRSPQDAAGLSVIEAGFILTPGVPDVDYLVGGKADLSASTGKLRISQAPPSATELPESEFDALMADEDDIGNRYQRGHIIYTGHDGDPVPVDSYTSVGLGVERDVIGPHDFEVGEQIIAMKSNGSEVKGVIVGIEPNAVTWQLLIEEL